jgi:hypothetical protein
VAAPQIQASTGLEARRPRGYPCEDIGKALATWKNGGACRSDFCMMGQRTRPQSNARVHQTLKDIASARTTQEDVGGNKRRSGSEDRIWLSQQTPTRSAKLLTSGNILVGTIAER